MTDKLLHLRQNPEMFKSFTALQNEVGVSFDSNVIAIASITSDKLSAAFAKAYADTFALNGSKVLIIDANMYNPSLATLLGSSTEDDVLTTSLDVHSAPIQSELQQIEENVSLLTMSQEIYPSHIYRNGDVAAMIEEKKASFDHIVVIVPSVKNHKEVQLLEGIIDSLLLVVRRSVETKKDIFEAACFFQEAKLPLAKAVILR